MEKLKDLPELQSEVAKKIPKLSNAVKLFENFSNNKHCMPILKHLMKAGNTTVYEYKFGEAPVRVEEPNLKFKVEDEESESGEREIDFGGENEIDFGEDGGEVNLEVRKFEFWRKNLKFWRKFEFWGEILNSGGEI